MYCGEFLKSLLERTGFVDVEIRSFRGSRYPDLNLDKPQREDHSVYVDARKKS